MSARPKKLSAQAQELARTAQELRTLVDRFKLECQAVAPTVRGTNLRRAA